MHNSIFKAFLALFRKLIVSELIETNESSSVCMHCLHTCICFQITQNNKKEEPKRFFFVRKEKYKQAQHTNLQAQYKIITAIIYCKKERRGNKMHMNACMQ